MDEPFVIAAADDVRGLVSSLMLKREVTHVRLGSVTLAPHQLDAVSRVRAAIAEFGGAFLCDVVGSGKTYTALAIAGKMTNPLIVAPAGLREMWKDAMRATGVRATLITIESLSRRLPVLDTVDGIVVDEAHHFRNHGSARHRNLCKLIGQRPIVLVTATPIHNSRDDLHSLAATFMGARSRALSSSELARLVVRRGMEQVSTSSSIPRIAPTEWRPTPDDPSVVERLLALPPPVPFREAGEITALFAHGLIRQWASSEAALRAAISRRVRRAASLEISLEGGEYPSVNEIRSWLAGDETIQLGFPGLMQLPRDPGCPELLDAVRAHTIALREFSKSEGDEHSLDDARAELVSSIANDSQGSLIVAFATYEATVTMLFKRLAARHRVAMLTSHGGRVAGGPITRREIVDQFSPERLRIRDAERIELLLTTDLLSEGVNLQRANVAIHLDLPWTSARMEQRVGRIARIGSRHARVNIFGISPPESAERVLRGSSLVRHKWRAARVAIGAQQDHGLCEPPVPAAAPPELNEEIRQVLSSWTTSAILSSQRTVVAAACSPIDGFLAVIEEGDTAFLIAGINGTLSVEPQVIHQAVTASAGASTAVDDHQANCAISNIGAWMLSSRSRDMAGLGATSFLRARRKALNVIDAVAASARPSVRPAQAPLIESARRVAVSRLGAANEDAIQEFAKRERVAPAKWLEEIAAIGAPALSREARSYRIRAILLLVTPPPSS